MFWYTFKLVSVTLQKNCMSIKHFHFDLLSLLKLTRKDILGVTEKASMSVLCCAFLVSVSADTTGMMEREVCGDFLSISELYTVDL